MARSAFTARAANSPNSGRASTVLPRPARIIRNVITPSRTRRGHPGSRPFHQAHSRNQPLAHPDAGVQARTPGRLPSQNSSALPLFASCCTHGADPAIAQHRGILARLLRCKELTCAYMLVFGLGLDSISGRHFGLNEGYYEPPPMKDAPIKCTMDQNACILALIGGNAALRPLQPDISFSNRRRQRFSRGFLHAKLPGAR